MSQIVKNIKPVFEETVFPVVKLLNKIGITPNILTVTGLILVGISSFFILKGNFFVGALFLIAGNLCDAIDGVLARRFNKSSTFGAFLDSVIDRISDFLPLIAIGIFYIKNDYMLILSIYTAFISLMVSYTRARAEGLGIDCKVGVLERTERSVILILTLLFDIVTIGLIAIAIGATLTVFQRIYCVYKNS